MEGRREDGETSPSLLYSAVSPPREVDGLSQIWPLPGIICYGAKVDGSAAISSQALMSIWPFFV